MQIPQLRMESQMGRISIEQTAGKLEINQPKPTVSIEQPKANLQMQTTKGKLTIDQSQAWEEMNLESTYVLIHNHAAESRSAATEGTARRAEQGAELLNIQSGVDLFPEQAEVNGNRAMKTLSIKYIPSPFSVKFSYERGQLNINAQENKPVIDVEVNKPLVNFVRGGVNVAMDQYPSLTIDVEHPPHK